jgi:hypothetical protein
MAVVAEPRLDRFLQDVLERVRFNALKLTLEGSSLEGSRQVRADAGAHEHPGFLCRTLSGCRIAEHELAALSFIAWVWWR